MIEINLLPQELRKREAVKLALPGIPVKGALVGFFSVFFAAQLLLSALAFYRRAEISHVRKAVEILKAENREITHQKSEITFARTRLQQVQSITERKFYWSLLLNALSDSVTKGIWLRQFSIMETGGHPGATARSLKLDGSVVGPGQETASIGKFIKELKDNPVLSELWGSVELATINQRKIRDYDVYDFTLACAFRKDKV